MRWVALLLLVGCSHTLVRIEPLTIYVPAEWPSWGECQDYCSSHQVEKGGVVGGQCEAVIQDDVGKHFMCKPYDV